MYCIYVGRPIMEASSTLEDIRPPVVSRWSRKVKNNCLRLQCHNILLYLLLKYQLTIRIITNVIHVVKHNSVYNYLVRDTKGLVNVRIGGVFCISSTVGKYNIFVKVVIAVEGI